MRASEARTRVFHREKSKSSDKNFVGIRPLTRLVFAVLISLATPAKAASVPSNFDELLEKIQSRYSFSPLDFSSLTVSEGDVVFLPLHAIQSGQHQISFLEIYGRSKEIEHSVQKTGEALPYNSGRAAFSKSNAGQAVLLKDRAVLIDGNHKALTSLWFKAETFAVEIRHDWRHLSLEEALPLLLKEQLIWPYELGGDKSTSLSALTELKDNPLRNWVSLAMGRVKLKSDDSSGVSVHRKKKVKHPLAVKINRDQAYLEWILVLALEAKNFTGHLGEEDRPGKKSVEDARQILREVRASADFPEYERLQKILLIEDSADYVDDERLEKILTLFLQKQHCQSLVKLPEF